MEEFRKEFTKKYFERTKVNLDYFEGDLLKKVDKLVGILIAARDEKRTNDYIAESQAGGSLHRWVENHPAGTGQSQPG